MPFDVAEDVLYDFFEDTESVTLTRRGTGSFDANGRWTNDVAISTFIDAVVQPAPSRDLQNMPEGAQINGAKAFFTFIELFALNDVDNTVADLLTHEGRTYEITSVTPWGSYGYYKSIGTLKRDIL